MAPSMGRHSLSLLLLQLLASASAAACAAGEYGFNGTCRDCSHTNPWGDEAVGTICSKPGVELASLPVKPGYYRERSSSQVVRQCQKWPAACLGGTDPTNQCAAGTRGFYCGSCAPQYFSENGGQCKPCGTTAQVTAGIVVGILLIVLALLGLCLGYGKLRQLSPDKTPKLHRLSQRITTHGLRWALKFRLLFSLLQVLCGMIFVMGGFPPVFSAVLVWLSNVTMFFVNLPGKVQTRVTAAPTRPAPRPEPCSR